MGELDNLAGLVGQGQSKRELKCPITFVIGGNIADTVTFGQPVMMVDESGQKTGNRVEKTPVNFAEFGVNNPITRRGLVAFVEMGIFSPKDLNKILVAQKSEDEPAEDMSLKAILNRAFGGSISKIRSASTFPMSEDMFRIYMHFPLLRFSLIETVDNLESNGDTDKGLALLDAIKKLYIGNRTAIQSQVISEFSKNRNLEKAPDQLIEQLCNIIYNNFVEFREAYVACVGGVYDMDPDDVNKVAQNEALSGWRFLWDIHKSNPDEESQLTSATRRSVSIRFPGNVIKKSRLVDASGVSLHDTRARLAYIMLLANGDEVTATLLGSCPFFEASFVME